MTCCLKSKRKVWGKYMGMIKIPNGEFAEVAEYKDMTIIDYQNNPFIEALPRIMNSDEVVEKLAFYPSYHTRERELDSHYRIHSIQRIFQCFQPMPMGIELESKVSRAIRQGYIFRNPMSPELAAGYHEDYSKMNNLSLGIVKVSHQMACGFSLIGISGLGKTSTLERILKMYPQIIAHSEYKGNKLSTYQVTYIKLECPFDGSVKGLILEFLLTVDRMLGTNYHQKAVKTRPTTDILISIMNIVVRNCNIGLIIIDEIQNLSMSKSGGSEKMMNFFVNMVNMVGIPLLMVGTPNAIGTLQSQFRLARRGVGIGGDMVCDRITRGKVWELLVSSVWEYQWTRKHTPLNEELIEVLYNETQGIPDLLKKIYAITQVNAITSGKEEITPELIQKVAKEELKLVQPMIHALRTGDVRKLAKYEDICFANIDMEGVLNNAKHTIELDSRVKTIQKKRMEAKENNLMSKKEQAVLKLIDLGYEAQNAQKLIDKVSNKDTEMDINSMVISAISQKSSKTKRVKSLDRNIKKSDTSDIRNIVEMGKKCGKTAYQSLLDCGYIKEFKDEIFVR